LGASALAFSFFGEALPNAFLENRFMREAIEGRIFFYYRDKVKKSGSFSSSNSLGEAICKRALSNRP
jgi:hypothetical protein